MDSIKKVIFIVWIVVIAILSIIPHANENEGLSLKLTESGMVVHFMAYFVGSALFYWAFIKGPPQYDLPDLQGGQIRPQRNRPE